MVPPSKLSSANSRQLAASRETIAIWPVLAWMPTMVARGPPHCFRPSSWLTTGGRAAFFPIATAARLSTGMVSDDPQPWPMTCVARRSRVDRRRSDAAADERVGRPLDGRHADPRGDEHRQAADEEDEHVCARSRRGARGRARRRGGAAHAVPLQSSGVYANALTLHMRRIHTTKNTKATTMCSGK